MEIMEKQLKLKSIEDLQLLHFREGILKPRCRSSTARGWDSTSTLA